MVNEELVEVVAEFLHREVGASAEDARHDATVLLGIIQSHGGMDVLSIIAGKKNWCQLFYDADSEVQDTKWEITIGTGDGQQVQYGSDSFEDFREWVVEQCESV